MRVHPHDLLIQELFTATGEDYQAVLDHVVQCTACQLRTRRLLHVKADPFVQRVLPFDRWSSLPADYALALERSISRISSLHAFYERERAEAVGLFSELLDHPPGRRIWILRNHPRFQTWGLFEILLKRSREQNFQDVALAEDLALLALEIPDRLDGFSTERIEDLRARAWACIGNARRVRSDLRGAEEAFAIAFSHLVRGSREPMERATLLDLKASLRRAQRRFPEALRLLHRAITLFLQLGEKHLAGRSLVNMAIVLRYAGEPEKAIPLLYQALDLIDPTREPRLLLFAWNNLIDDLADNGQFMEAQGLLAKARPMYRQFPQPWVQNRSKWVEGRIARGLGQNRQAESLFLAARDGFLAEDAAYDTALVSLDLASLYAEQGRMAELKRVAEEMVPIFSSRQIHREALAALSYWRQAVEAEEACADLVTGVAAFLKRARHNPELRFQKPE
ncbi:MAG TPA: tetratricopeptide repeat protein [Thermoanaerobaculia bacterium]|jgi:tetratricopeptide (TPR) repeat protein|nr:tetratricopeptide repeat protein [Thermoanaerobaculia bacterium]